MDTLKVKIVKADGDQYWYKNRIGDVVEVTRTTIDGEFYYILTQNELDDALERLMNEGDEDALAGTIHGLTITINNAVIETGVVN